MAEAGAATAIIAALSLAYGVASGEQQRAVQKRGLRRQEEAQQKAESAAIREARVGEEETNRARQKRPDLSVLLGEQATARPGPTGIDMDRLLLGRPGLLGY